MNTDKLLTQLCVTRIRHELHSHNRYRTEVIVDDTEDDAGVSVEVQSQ